MNQSRQENIEQLLQLLAEGRTAELRFNALVRLPVSPVDERIARALLTASVSDPEPPVRDLAARILETPAYRDLLANRPDLQREAHRAGASLPQGEIVQKAQSRAFERRRADQVRMSYIIFAFLVILFAIMWLQVQSLAPLAFLLSLALVIGYLLFTWQNWRCPKCRANLWSKPPRVDPWRKRGEIKCPHCGAQLR